jgi:uncharacterized membrane protein YfcA
VLEALGIGLIATLYSSVGHAGASGYIALFSLLGRSALEIRWMALELNLCVSLLTALQFTRAGALGEGQFKRVVLPLILGSIPFAWIGGAIVVPLPLLRQVLAFVLLFSALRFLWNPKDVQDPKPPSFWILSLLGSGLGLVSGLTGTGGGIFLSPLALFLGWSRTRQTAAISAWFIFFNSAAGLLGGVSRLDPLSGIPEPWSNPMLSLIGAAVLGGVLGSHLGSRRFSVVWIRRLLALTLGIASVKLMLGG